MELEFVKGSPALLVKKERALVLGDLHIGRDIALAKSGIHVPEANERMIASIKSLVKETDARMLVLLGDVKESVANPSKDEYYELSRFFYELRKTNVVITKGNHDAHMPEIIKRLCANAAVTKELLLEKAALMHGNNMPSQEAMRKDWILMGHSHPALERGGRMEKVFLVSKVGKRASSLYKDYNKKARVAVLPAFNELISGSDPSSLENFSPQFRRGIFETKGARIYGLNNEPVAKL